MKRMLRCVMFICLCLLSLLAGCDLNDGKVVYLRVSPLPEGTVTLEVEPRLNEAPAPRDKLRFNEGLGDRVGIRLPRDAGGNLRVSIDALDAVGCRLASGEGGVQVVDGAEVTVPLAPVTTRSCLGDDMATPDMTSLPVNIVVAVRNLPQRAAALRVQPTLAGRALETFSRGAVDRFEYTLPPGSKGALKLRVEALDGQSNAIAGGSAEDTLVAGLNLFVGLSSYDDPGCDAEGKTASCDTGNSYCQNGRKTCSRSSGVLRWGECVIVRDAVTCPPDGTTRSCTAPRYSCAGTQSFNANSSWSACQPLGRCDCSVGTPRSCSCVDPLGCPAMPNGVPGGTQTCVRSGNDQIWPTSCSCGVFPNIPQCHKVEFYFDDVDVSGALFKSNANGNSLGNQVYSFRGPSSRLFNVWTDLANQNISTRQEFVFKVLNSNCGWSDGWLRVYVDNDRRLSSYRGGGVAGHCGWTYRKVFTVDFATGWVDASQPESTCFWPTDCQW